MSLIVLQEPGPYTHRLSFGFHQLDHRNRCPRSVFDSLLPMGGQEMKGEKSFLAFGDCPKAALGLATWTPCVPIAELENIAGRGGRQAPWPFYEYDWGVFCGHPRAAAWTRQESARQGNQQESPPLFCGGSWWGVPSTVAWRDYR
jgi:hypothetical protein